MQLPPPFVFDLYLVKNPISSFSPLTFRSPPKRLHSATILLTTSVETWTSKARWSV